MIALLSAFGILGLIGLRLVSIWQDRPEDGFKKYLAKEMTRTAAEFLAILLSVTIGLNLGEIQQDKQQKEQIMALLDVSVIEIKGSLSANRIFYQPYAELEEGETVPANRAETLQTAAKCNTVTLEKILDMESVLSTITPSAYNFICVNIDSAQRSFDRLQTLDPETQSYQIGQEVRVINAHIEMMISAIELEQRHLKGELTPQQVSDAYYNEFVADPAA